MLRIGKRSWTLRLRTFVHRAEQNTILSSGSWVGSLAQLSNRCKRTNFTTKGLLVGVMSVPYVGGVYSHGGTTLFPREHQRRLTFRGWTSFDGCGWAYLEGGTCRGRRGYRGIWTRHQENDGRRGRTLGLSTEEEVRVKGNDGMTPIDITECLD